MPAVEDKSDWSIHPDTLMYVDDVDWSYTCTPNGMTGDVGGPTESSPKVDKSTVINNSFYYEIGKCDLELDTINKIHAKNQLHKLRFEKICAQFIECCLG
jgi:hypothetical protein